MGLGRTFLSVLIDLRRRGHVADNARVIEIGSQQLSDDFLEADELDELYGLFGRARPELGASQASEKLRDDAPAARPFWTSLGCSYAAIDYDGHRDSTALDLNRDSVPDKLLGAFDLVVNSGTTEHVANQDNAFRVIHDLTARDGIMMHEVPAGGWDHGLISYNPTFFLYLEKQNDYELISKIDRRENDMTIRACLRKRNDRPFETPLDVPNEIMPMKYKSPWRQIRRAIV